MYSKLLYGLYIDIWHNLENNSWIYVQSKTNKFSIKCNDNIKGYSIPSDDGGEGILTLSENSVAFSKPIRLEPSSYSNFVFNSNLNINFDTINDDCKKTLTNRFLFLFHHL